MLGACLFADQGLVDMRNDATARDRCFDQTVQLLQDDGWESTNVVMKKQKKTERKKKNRMAKAT